MRTDPRIRQSLNQFSENLESAADNARAGCFALSNYLEPFFTKVADTCASYTLLCMPGGRYRRRRAEFPFDFYNDDYYDEDSNAFLGWGNDELDRLLAGSGSTQRGYTRQPIMTYGIAGHSGGNRSGLGNPPRRKSAVVPHDGGPDPTIIPNTSYFGFLGRVPFMRSTLRYKPSAADLQEHPQLKGHGSGRGAFRRQRSSTNSSRETEDSLRSRADLFPSEDEADAVPLGDEFDVGLRSSGASETSLSIRRYGKGKGKGKLNRQSSAGSSSLEASSIEARLEHNLPAQKGRYDVSEDSGADDERSLEDYQISINSERDAPVDGEIAEVQRLIPQSPAVSAIQPSPGLSEVRDVPTEETELLISYAEPAVQQDNSSLTTPHSILDEQPVFEREETAELDNFLDDHEDAKPQPSIISLLGIPEASQPPLPIRLAGQAVRSKEKESELKLERTSSDVIEKKDSVRPEPFHGSLPDTTTAEKITALPALETPQTPES